MTLHVGSEVGRDVALVKTHTFDEVHVHAEALALFNGYDAVLADLVDGVSNERANFGVGGGDGGHLSNLLFGISGLSQGVQ